MLILALWKLLKLLPISDKWWMSCTINYSKHSHCFITILYDHYNSYILMCTVYYSFFLYLFILMQNLLPNTTWQILWFILNVLFSFVLLANLVSRHCLRVRCFSMLTQCPSTVATFYYSFGAWHPKNVLTAVEECTLHPPLTGHLSSVKFHSLKLDVGSNRQAPWIQCNKTRSLLHSAGL